MSINRKMNHYWEDMSVGETISGDAVSITESHLVIWAGLTFDNVPLHLNDEYAKATRFGARIAHGPLTLAMGLGLMTQTRFFENTIAWLGLDKVRALAPVFIGDTIRPVAKLITSRPTSKPGAGLWVLEYTISNQNRVSVMTFESSFLVTRRVDKEPVP